MSQRDKFCEEFMTPTFYPSEMKADFKHRICPYTEKK